MMKRARRPWTTLLLLLAFLLPGLETSGFWNPLAKKKEQPKAADPIQKGKTPQASEAHVEHPKRVYNTHMMLMNGKKLNSPVSSQWRSTPPGKDGGDLRSGLLGTAFGDFLRYKQDPVKIKGVAGSEWRERPNGTDISSRGLSQSMFKSIFKSKPPTPIEPAVIVRGAKSE